jgi:uncharacterized protein YdhG (YjbR/CyaY superfamily)
MKKTKSSAPKTIDEYLAEVPEPARSRLQEVRATVRSVAPPEATECISYRMPAFMYNGPLIYFAAFAKHCSIFPASLAVIAAFKDELKGFHTSKGTIQFALDKPFPTPLLNRMLKARLAELERKKKR